MSRYFNLITLLIRPFPVDPDRASDQDRVTKLRVQKERQTQALLLSRQVTGLLQRTRLNVSVTCQAIHSKNARHMLLGEQKGIISIQGRILTLARTALIDYINPTMVIVGSRGLGKLKG